MTRLAILLLSAAVVMPVAAQMHDHGDANGHTPPATGTSHGHEAEDAARERNEAVVPHARRSTSERAAEPAGKRPPPEAFSGPAHAADALFGEHEMAEARARLRAEEGGLQTYLVVADRLESRVGDGDEHYLWDVQGWYGGDMNRLWLKTEGQGRFGSSPHDAELQALYSRAISPFFDVQVGVRHDVRPAPDRSHLVVGVKGLLPYVFELDAAAFLSDQGDLTARVEAEYDLRITQRLILEPRIELNLAAQDVPALGIGSGLGSIEAGLRLRYELRRELAPYIGIGWESALGETADIARAAGEKRRRLNGVLGVRAWF